MRGLVGDCPRSLSLRATRRVPATQNGTDTDTE